MLLEQKYCFKILPYLTWSWPDLSQKSSLMTSESPMSTTIDTCMKNDTESMCRTAYLRLIFSDHLRHELDLELFRYYLNTHAVPCLDIWVCLSSLGTVLPALGPKQRFFFLTFNLTVICHMTLIMKCYARTRCVTTRAFKRRPVRLATTLTFRVFLGGGSKKTTIVVKGVWLRPQSVPG